ncbi:DNA damage-inducible protein F [invertebrate metagenome]|uniref:DNA damage-inducible protein F n=1 Tax=invertebrate metagenome TaxID=1711999 RepID=A0A2H9TBH0_9ZZZZ
MAHSKVFRRVWQFAWPAILANISVPLLGLVDAAVLGHLSSSEFLGGVAVGTTMLSIIFWAFGFLRMGTTGMIAQARGRRDSVAIARGLLQSVFLAIGIGGILLLGAPLILSLGLPFFYASDSVSAQADVYFTIRMLSAPAVLMNYTLIGWLLGMQKPRYSLLILLLSNILNIVLDLLFVTVWGMATRGAALATVIADYSSLVLGIWLVYRLLPMPVNRKLLCEAIDGRAFYRLLVVNRHLFIRTLCLLSAQAFFTSRGAQLGDDVLAANALLLNFLMLISNGLDGIANAAESLSGEALGQRREDKFRQVLSVTGLCSLVCGVGLTLVFALGGSTMINGLTSIPAVADNARYYLPWLIIMPLVSVWCFWLDGIFIGAMKTRAMQNTTLLASLCVFLPAWYFSKGLGNNGIWLTYTLFMSARSLGLLAVCYYLSCRHKWVSACLHHDTEVVKSS